MLLLKDECSLCKRVISSQFLRRCIRCGRLYCLDCTTFTDEGIICLNCARRMVSPTRYGTKYSPLSRYLLRRGRFTDHAVLSFATIEGIIGDNLPFKAARDAEWWSNTRASPQGRAWIDIGWETQGVDLEKRSVTFKRVAVIEAKLEKKLKKKKTAQTPFFKKGFHLTRPKKREPPSKTKIARAIARLKNAERAASSPQFKVRFKSRSAYEKRLFKPDEKPSKS